MLHSKARWQTGCAESSVVQKLAEAHHLDTLTARLLALRGITTPEAAESFSHSRQDGFHDPFLMKDMKKAVDRIRLAVEHKEFIRIYGDYDADGVTSTSLVMFLLRKIKARFDYYIPHRVREGYGLNRQAVEKAAEDGVDLIITVDTGVSAVEQVTYIQELGMDVIVTDHHEPPDILPQPLALVNPKQADCPYPFKHLAGVGVAFKLAHALLDRVPEELLELVAIGTVADLMPLHGENRTIVKMGLKRMQQSAFPGIRALLKIAGIESQQVTSTHLGFAVGPRLNASGRLGSANNSVELLITGDSGRANELAQLLDELNQERQRIVREINEEALAITAEQVQKGNTFLVVAKPDWNEGVIGIVASKIVETYYRPTIVFSMNDESGLAKGSARSIESFDMYENLTACRELLEHFGGHRSAAGMTIKQEHIDALHRQLDHQAKALLGPDDLVPVIRADAACHLKDVPLGWIEQLQKLEPFGASNPSPQFIVENLRLTDLRLLGRDKKHMKLVLSESQGESTVQIEALGFGKAHLSELISPTARLDVLGELGINEWNGIRRPQLTLKDLRITEIQLFDWRGTADAAARMDSLKAALAASEGCPDMPAVVAFAGMHHHALPQRMDALGCPLWIWRAGRGLKPANERAQGLVFGQMADIVLYSLPTTLGAVEQVLAQAECLERCYAMFKDERSSAETGMPSRDQFKLVYGSVLKQGSWDVKDQRLMTLFSRRSGLSPAMIEFMLTVFGELGFIQEHEGRYVPVPSPAKQDLSKSASYQERMKLTEVEQFCFYSSASELHQWLLKQRMETSKEVLEETTK
ncbi:single-stranded-DNA-specific exonuclease RecJ [Paenibacillus larvae]